MAHWGLPQAARLAEALLAERQYQAAVAVGAPAEVRASYRNLRSVQSSSKGVSVFDRCADCGALLESAEELSSGYCVECCPAYADDDMEEN